MILKFYKPDKIKLIARKRAKSATLKYVEKYASFAEYSCLLAGLHSRFNRYERWIFPID